MKVGHRLPAWMQAVYDHENVKQRDPTEAYWATNPPTGSIAIQTYIYVDNSCNKMASVIPFSFFLQRLAKFLKCKLGNSSFCR